MTDHSDLIERLREPCIDWTGEPIVDGSTPRTEVHCGLLREAADALSSQSLSLSEAREEIERLKRESADRLKCMDRRADRLIDLWDRVNAAERALGPFAAVASVDIGSDETDEDIFQQPGHYHRAPRITVGNMRRARTALEICKSGLADATNDPSSSDLSSLRKGAEVAPLEYVRPHGCEFLTKAETIIGEACVWTHHEANGAWFWKLGSIASGTEANEADAKKMLWATYEHRIRSALVSGSREEQA